MTNYIYTTKRKMLLNERKSLQGAIDSAYSALTSLLNGDIQSYNLGRWSISRNKADIDKLQDWIDKTRIRIDEIDNILSGKSARKISTCIYTNPQNVAWWRY